MNDDNQQHEIVSQNNTVANQGNLASAITTEVTPKKKLNNKKKIYILLVAALSVISGGIATYFLLNRSNQDGPVDSSQNTVVVNNDSDTNTIAPIEVPSYAIVNNKEDYNDYIGLLLNDQTLIEENSYKWKNFQRWNDWILFYKTEQDVPNDPGSLYTSTVYSFNLVTHEYKKLSEVPKYEYISIYQTFVSADYLYVGLDEYKAEGLVVRCKLSEEDLCSSFETFYEGSGEVQYIDDENVLTFDSFGDAGFTSNKINNYNPKTNVEKTIADVSAYNGNGTVLVNVQSNGVLWFIESKTDADPATDIEPENVNYQFIRMYAVDLSGDEIISLSASDMPILNPRDTSYVVLADDEVLLSNGQQETIYNTSSRTFSDVQPVGTAQSQNDKVDDTNKDLTDAQETLRLPASYSLLYTQRSQRNFQ